MKRSLALAVLIPCLLVVFILPLAVNGETHPEELLFTDDFDQPTLDTSKWEITENTNMSGFPANGGTIQLANGTVTLSSNGSSFPWITAASNPFLEEGNFELEVKLGYVNVSDLGTGFVVTTGGSPIFYEDEDDIEYDVVLQVWTDSIGTRAFFFDRIVWRLNSGWGPQNESLNVFKLQFFDGVYTLLVDDIVVSQVATQVRANRISFGHPPCYYVPFSAEEMKRVWGWSSFQIDYVKVKILTEPTETDVKPPALTALSLSTSVTQNSLGFYVDINGTLRANQTVSVPDATVRLYYRLPSYLQWYPISSVATDTNGAFSATWLPSATGNFIIKAEFAGDENYAFALAIRDVSITRGSTSEGLFFVESNSTLSAISFNSTANEVTFTVSGPAGSTGYVRFLVSKTLIGNLTELKAFMDGNEVQFTATELGDMIVLYFEYPHSTHTVTIKRSEAAIPEFPSWILLPLAVVSVASALVLRKKRRT